MKTVKESEEEDNRRRSGGDIGERECEGEV